jgi:hypothetical protein
MWMDYLGHDGASHLCENAEEMRRRLWAPPSPLKRTSKGQESAPGLTYITFQIYGTVFNVQKQNK